MKMLIGGAVALLLGIYGIASFYESFFSLVVGVVPVTLILAGGLMVYLNRESILPGADQEYSEEETAQKDSIVEPPAAEDRSAEIPAVEEPAVEEPVAEEPVVEEPVVEEPVVEEPVVEESVPEEPVAEELAVEEPAAEEPAAEESPFVGNTDSKVFHTQDCKFAQSKKCTDFFAKKEDAVQAGYKPCSRCKP